MITQMIDMKQNTLIVGATRTGKTSTVLKPLVYELLLLKKNGIPLGMTIIENKKDVGETLKEMCKEMDIPFATTGRVQRDGILVVDLFDNNKHYKEMIEFGKLKIQQVVGDFFNDDDKKRQTPHFLIVDEMDQFVYPEFEEFLALSPSYNVTGIFTMQTLHRLGLGVETGSDKEKNTMLSAFLVNCRNKMVFGNASYEEAVMFSNMFGNVKPEDLMCGLPCFQCIVQTVQDGKVQKPFLYQGEFLPADWKEKREWENDLISETLGNEAAEILNGFKCNDPTLGNDFGQLGTVSNLFPGGISGGLVGSIGSTASPVSLVKGGPIGINHGCSIGTTSKQQDKQDEFSMESLIEQKTDEARRLIGYVAFLNYLSQYCQTLEPYFRGHQVELIGKAQKKLEQREDAKQTVSNLIEELKNEINSADRPELYRGLAYVIKDYELYSGTMMQSVEATLSSLRFE